MFTTRVPKLNQAILTAEKEHLKVLREEKQIKSEHKSFIVETEVCFFLFFVIYICIRVYMYIYNFYV